MVYASAGEECDARLMQIDEFNFLKILDRDDVSEEAKETCRELLAANQKFSETAIKPSVVNSAFLAPLVGKPLAELETLFAAAKYYTGVDVADYEEMISSSKDKYKYHNPLNSFLSSAAMGFVRGVSSSLESNKVQGYAAYGLKAAIFATDLYLYSQSIVPLGMSILAATLAENSGCNPMTCTALKYGCSALINQALDPGASFLNTAMNTGISIAGAALGAKAAEVIDKSYKKYYKAKDDNDLRPNSDIESYGSLRLKDLNLEDDKGASRGG